MSHFKIGEIATLCNSIRPQYDGMDCEIIGGLELRASIQQPNVEKLLYRIQTADGRKFVVAPYYLRKKPRKLDDQTAAWTEALDVIDRVKSPAWVGV